MSPGARGVLDHVVHERVDPRRAARAEHRDRLARQLLLAQQSCAHRVVDVVVDVRHAVDHPHDPPLERLRRRRAARVARDPVAHLLGQVQPRAVALEMLDDPQRVLVVAKVASEARFQAAVEHLLADVPERRVPEVVAEADRLDQILVQPQRPRHRARDRRHLQRVRQPRAVVVAARRHEHLRLVRQAAKRLAVHDPVAVALKRRAQRAVVLPRAPAAPDTSAPPAARAAAPLARERARRNPPTTGSRAHRLRTASVPVFVPQSAAFTR